MGGGSSCDSNWQYQCDPAYRKIEPVNAPYERTCIAPCPPNMMEDIKTQAYYYKCIPGFGSNFDRGVYCYNDNGQVDLPVIEPSEYQKTDSECKNGYYEENDMCKKNIKKINITVSDVTATIFGHVNDNPYKDPTEQANAFCKKPNLFKMYIGATKLSTKPVDSDGDVIYHDFTYVDYSDEKNPRNIILLGIPSTSYTEIQAPACVLLQGAHNLEAAYITSNEKVCPYTYNDSFGPITKVMSKNLDSRGTTRYYGCYDKINCAFPNNCPYISFDAGKNYIDHNDAKYEVFGNF